jgi:hypothetical protein
MTAGFAGVALALTLIGLANQTFLLVIAVCLFAFSMRIFSIAVNTQAIALQKQFARKINGAFHGLWSTGGIVGVGISTILVAMQVGMIAHFAIVTLLTLPVIFYAFPFLMRNDRMATGNKLNLGKPDPYIVFLGLMVFFAAICEGGMFDWSGVYFREVVGENLFTLGYLIFMIFMASSRFLTDRLLETIGMPRMYILSACLIVSGITIAVVFPKFWSCMIGFCLVGFGTAAIIPMTFLLAGSSQKYSPGMAISIIASYSTVGMLIGPPLIGYIAHAFELRIAFILFAVAGFLLAPVSQLFFRYQRALSPPTASPKNAQQ